MRIVLWLSITSFTAFFCWIATRRRVQIQQQAQLARLESQSTLLRNEALPETLLKLVGQTDV